MELNDYLAVVRKRWLSIVLVLGLAVVGAIAVNLLSTPMYQARSQVFVSVSTGGTTTELLQGSNFTRGQVKSYTDLVTSPRVLGPVIEELGLATDADALALSITASSPLDTVLINIAVMHEDPETASEVANAVAESLAVEVTDLERVSETQPSPVKISTVRTATVPTAPASPNNRLNLALGVLIGLTAGVGLALAREVLDTAVKTEADIREITQASVIATIGFDENASQHPLIVQSSPHSHRSEAFRRLRTNLQFLDVANRPRSIVVTSSLPGEGKSTTAINLAITLADAGSRVALVDADLRRPSVAGYLGIEGRVGLTTVLIGKATLSDVIQPWGNGDLSILPSGEIPPNPSELLGSRSMRRLLEQLTEEFDVVLIDSAPLLPVTDAAIVATLSGGALVVVGSDMLNRQQVTDALSTLENAGARVLGIVLNRISRKRSDPYTYYDYADHSNPVTKPDRDLRSRPASSPRDHRRPVRTRTRQPPRDVSRTAAHTDRSHSVESIRRMLQPSDRSDAAEEEVAGGEVAEGEIAGGDAAVDEVAVDEVAGGDVAEGNAADGELAEGEAAEGEAAEGEAARADRLPGEPPAGRPRHPE